MCVAFFTTFGGDTNQYSNAAMSLGGLTFDRQQQVGISKYTDSSFIFHLPAPVTPWLQKK